MRIGGNASIAPLSLPLAAGRYYMGPQPWSAATSNTLGNGTLRVFPLYIPNQITLTKIGAEVTSTGEAGSKFRIGIYADDGTGYPGSLVLDAGQIAGDSATVQELSVSTAIAAGWYWFGGAVQSAPTTQPTMRIAAVGTTALMSSGTSAPSAGVAWVGVAQTSVTGALPSTFGTPSGTAGSFARIHFKL